MSRVSGCLVAMVLVLVACGGGEGGSDGAEAAEQDGTAADVGATSTAGTTGTPTAAELCDDAAPVDGDVSVQADLTELSGLAASRQNPGVLWAHDDSGGGAEVFALGADGAGRGRYPLAGAEAADWEDMAIARGPDGADTLIVADIGDNDATRDTVAVHRVPEPQLAAGAAGRTVAPVETLRLAYADGPRDAETLLADPRTGDLLVLDKDWSGVTGVYRAPAEAAPNGTVTMARVAEVTLPGGLPATGGDISPDGALVAVRTYAGVLLWDRGSEQTVAEALTGTPCRAPAATEAQGEAIAVTPDGRGYTTIGEGAHPPVNGFALPPS